MQVLIDDNTKIMSEVNPRGFGDRGPIVIASSNNLGRGEDNDHGATLFRHLSDAGRNTLVRLYI